MLHSTLCRFKDPINNALMLIFQFAPILMKFPFFSSYNQTILDDLNEALSMISNFCAKSLFDFLSKTTDMSERRLVKIFPAIIFIKKFFFLNRLVRLKTSLRGFRVVFFNRGATEPLVFDGAAS